MYSTSVNAVTIDPGTEFEVGNVTYGVNQSMEFSQVVVGSDYIIFNNTNITISSPNSINITLVYLNDDIANASITESVFTFYGNTTAGIVWFNMSGDFPNNNQYTINLDGSPSYTIQTDPSGLLSFNHSSWSEHLFDIVNGSSNASAYLRVKYHCPDALFNILQVLPVLLAVLVLVTFTGLAFYGDFDLNTSIVILVAMIIGVAGLIGVSASIVDETNYNTETFTVTNPSINQILDLTSSCGNPSVDLVQGYNASWVNIPSIGYSVSGRTITVYKEYLYV